MPLVKVELHAHTSDDPDDAIAHSLRQLVDRASHLGYGALAVTLHDRYFDDDEAVDFAAARGLLLLRGIERTIQGRHILLINFSGASGEVASLEDTADLKRREPHGLVVAPHPWFPFGRSLGRERLERHADLWDAIEINAFYTTHVDFNRRAWLWARDRRKPLVGNGDVHQLEQLGTTYSMVQVEGPLTPAAVCDAIRAGRVHVESVPLTYAVAGRIATRGFLSSVTRRPW